MVNILLPRREVDLTNRFPMFLEGPMAGTLPWRMKAVDLILQNTTREDILFVSPDESGFEDRGFQSVGQIGHRFNISIPTEKWEREYIGECSQRGAILVWIPKRTLPCDSYAFGTSREVGYLAQYARKDNLFIGISPEFRRQRETISFIEDVLKITPYSSIEDTCKAIGNFAQGLI